MVNSKKYSQIIDKIPAICYNASVYVKRWERK